MKKFLSFSLVFLSILGSYFPQFAWAEMPCGPIEANPNPSNINELDPEYTEFVVSFLNALEVLPGTTIGIIKDDRLIYAMGFGVGDIEKCNPVGPDTGFYILSTTKSFTGMVGALLQEDGTLKLDEGLTTYFQDFTLPEPLSASQVTLRQLLTHGKPFSNGGVNFLRTAYGELKKEDELRILSEFSEPKPPTFEYSNTGYTFAALAFEKVTEKTWRELIKERIFIPLKMGSSTPYIEEALKSDFANRHSISLEKGLFRVPNKLEPQMHPAGGLVSTVPDLARWVRMNLNLGELDGDQVLPKAAVRQALAPQIQFDWQYYKFHRYAYGFGVHHSDYDGDLLIHHFGGAIHVSFMPEHGLGVIVLTNNVVAGGIASHRIAALTYDYLLDKEYFDGRVKAELHDALESKERILGSWDEQKKEALAQGDPDDPFVPEEQIIGTYASPRLMEFVIYRDGQDLVLKYGAVTAKMERLDGDSFSTLFDDLDQNIPQILTFREEGSDWVLDWEGRIFIRK